MFICRVCGYNSLDYPQYLDNGEPSFCICDCCGFESGYDDLDQGFSFDEYRDNWLKKGARWFNESKKPHDWNVSEQLKNIK